MKTEQDE